MKPQHVHAFHVSLFLLEPHWPLMLFLVSFSLLAALHPEITKACVMNKSITKKYEQNGVFSLVVNQLTALDSSESDPAVVTGAAD